MIVRVLGGRGAWPTAGQPCTGHLVEHEGFRLVLDLGYATFLGLLEWTPPERIDAVLITHGHPDHCADLHALVRARGLRDDPAPPLPVFALPGAVDAVMALDRPGLLDAAWRLHELVPGAGFDVGPFRVETRALPHSLPSVGVRLAAGGRVLVYTGDTGPSPDVAELAREADLLIAEASYPDEVPGPLARLLSSASQAGADAARAGARRLLLTHLMADSDPDASVRAARRSYAGPIDVARPGLAIDLA